MKLIESRQGALPLRSFIAPLVLDGSINRDAFESYVAKVLVLELRHGEVASWTTSPAKRGHVSVK